MTNAESHRRGDLTGQPANQPLTIFFVSGFLFLARFLLGFWGEFQRNRLKINESRWRITQLLHNIKSDIIQ